ncbi:hypothetical protein [Burkholderia diffusa]|uniref:hypothetical protein n=1 Tax=Burkholderia diffusa TaxID=488732 RepID=UPI0012DAAF29|nr:hypothetical protein [Burkholderia diffusa]
MDVDHACTIVRDAPQRTADPYAMRGADARADRVGTTPTDDRARPSKPARRLCSERFSAVSGNGTVPRVDCPHQPPRGSRPARNPTFWNDDMNSAANRYRRPDLSRANRPAMRHRRPVAATSVPGTRRPACHDERIRAASREPHGRRPFHYLANCTMSDEPARLERA